MMRAFVAVSAVLLYFILVGALSVWSKRKDFVAARLDAIQRQGDLGLGDANELSRPFSERFLRPGFSRLMRVVEGALPISAKAQRDLDEKLRSAGMRLSAREYVARNIVIAAVICALVFLVSFNFLYVVVALFAWYVLARFALTKKIKQRKEAIENGMPDVLDLLSTSVSAGLGFDQALQHVVARCQGPLVEELAVVQKEIALGTPRNEALHHLAERCGVEPLTTFVNSIAQADRLGIAISNVLITQATSIRDRHRQKIEERAAQLPVKILLPMILFILPAMFIILLGPAVPRIMQALGV